MLAIDRERYHLLCDYAVTHTSTSERRECLESLRRKRLEQPRKHCMSTFLAHTSAAPPRASITAEVGYRASLSLWPERLGQLQHSCTAAHVRSNHRRPCKLTATKVTASAATALLLDSTDSTSVLPSRAFRALPLSLLLGLAAAWVVSVRC